MTPRRSTSFPPPLPSTTTRNTWSVHDEDLLYNMSTLPNNYNDRCKDKSLSNHVPHRQLSRNAISKQQSKDCFSSKLGKWVPRTQSTRPSGGLYCLWWRGSMWSCVTSIWAGTWWSVWTIDLPTNVYNYYKTDPNEVDERLVGWIPGNMRRYGLLVDDVTGLIVGEDYNTQTTFSGVLALVMAQMKPIAINYVMFVNPFAMNAVRTTQIHSWQYEEIARTDPV